MTVSEYIEKNYASIKNWVLGTTRGEHTHLHDDFLQEVILIFLLHKKSELVIEKGEAQYFLVRIALNQWRSSTSPFYTKYKKNKSVDSLPINIELEDYDLKNEEHFFLVMYSLDQLKKTHKENEYLMILLYYTYNSNFTEVERRTGIPRTTVSHLFKQGIKNLKKIVDENKIKLEEGDLQFIPNYKNDSLNWFEVNDGKNIKSVSGTDQIFKSNYLDFL